MSFGQIQYNKDFLLIQGQVYIFSLYHMITERKFTYSQQAIVAQSNQGFEQTVQVRLIFVMPSNLE